MKWAQEKEGNEDMILLITLKMCIVSYENRWNRIKFSVNTKIYVLSLMQEHLKFDCIN